MSHRKAITEEKILDADGEVIFHRVVAQMVSRAKTIEEPDFYNLADDDSKTHRRVEEYRRLDAEWHRSLIRPFIPDPWAGRALIYAPQGSKYDHVRGIDSVPDHSPAEIDQE